MTNHSLKTIRGVMAALALEYGLFSYDKSPIQYPYFVGEYTENESMTEDGQQETTFLLTGFARSADGGDAWAALETARAIIANYFTREGRAFPADDGSIAVIMYSHALPVPKEDAALKSIEINLKIKEWSVN